MPPCRIHPHLDPQAHKTQIFIDAQQTIVEVLNKDWYAHVSGIGGVWTLIIASATIVYLVMINVFKDRTNAASEGKADEHGTTTLSSLV